MAARKANPAKIMYSRILSRGPMAWTYGAAGPAERVFTIIGDALMGDGSLTRNLESNKRE